MTKRRFNPWTSYVTHMNWDWVIPDVLATGSMPLRPLDADTLDGIGVTHVLNVADDVAGMNEHLLFSGRGMSYARIPTPDPPQRAFPEDAWWARSTGWARAALDIGGCLYVHCRAGSSRGPSVVYATLRQMGWSDAQAYEAVRKARPWADLYYVPHAMRWLGDEPEPYQLTDNDLADIDALFADGWAS